MQALAFDADPDEYRRAFLSEGVSWRNQYTRVVHGELTRRQIRQDAAWTTWRSGARPAVRRARRQPGRAAPSPRHQDVCDGAASAVAVIEQPRPAVDVWPSEELAQRISDALAGRDGVSEGTTFGCVTWMVNGNVACGVAGDKLLVRVDRCDVERIVVQAHVQPMKRGARTMRGFVTIDSDAITDDAQLARWIDAATAYAAWLSPKLTRSRSRSSDRATSPAADFAIPASRSAANADQPHSA